MITAQGSHRAVPMGRGYENIGYIIIIYTLIVFYEYPPELLVFAGEHLPQQQLDRIYVMDLRTALLPITYTMVLIVLKSGLVMSKMLLDVSNNFWLKNVRLTI